MKKGVLSLLTLLMVLSSFGGCKAKSKYTVDFTNIIDLRPTMTIEEVVLYEMNTYHNIDMKERNNSYGELALDFIVDNDDRFYHAYVFNSEGKLQSATYKEKWNTQYSFNDIYISLQFIAPAETANPNNVLKYSKWYGFVDNYKCFVWCGEEKAGELLGGYTALEIKFGEYKDSTFVPFGTIDK